MFDSNKFLKTFTAVLTISLLSIVSLLADPANSAANPQQLLDRAHMVERASADLHRQGIVHVMPISFAGVDGSLRLMIEVLERAKPSEAIKGTRALSKRDLLVLVPHLEVRTADNALSLAVRQPFTDGRPLIPVSAIPTKDKD